MQSIHNCLFCHRREYLGRRQLLNRAKCCSMHKLDSTGKKSRHLIYLDTIGNPLLYS